MNYKEAVLDCGKCSILYLQSVARSALLVI